MTRIQFGNMTDEQTREVAAEALATLTDDDALAVIVQWARSRDYVDELIANLEG